MVILPEHAGGDQIVRHHVQPPRLAARVVDVWCPPGYNTNQSVRYPVVYMHDGQNLFDPRASYSGETWGVGQAMATLIQQGHTSGAIIVGVWNSADRTQEYMPAQPLLAPEAASLRNEFMKLTGSVPVSDAYCRFLVSELKPLIDQNYRTLPDRATTFVMGSSMGGLISLYALAEYPQIFGGAACLSTHWTICGTVLVDGLAAMLPLAGQHRLYFDYGDQGLDAAYEPLQLRMNGHLQAAGYQFGRDALSLAFPGADHNEAAWRARIDQPLRFLLGAVGLDD